MAYSYKCNISFGLVYIPVRLVAAAKSNDISFNMIDKKTMSRIKYVKTDISGNAVESSDIVKGYEYEDDKYVIFTDKDFEKIKSPADKNIEIQSFVAVSEIDPVYYNKPFYVVPSGAEKAFGVLLAAMEEAGKAAIAKTVLGTKETLIAIRSIGGTMMLNTLYFNDEIQLNPYKNEGEVGKKELDLAKAIIGSMEEHFEPQKYRDEYRERLLEAIQAKVDGEEIKSPATPKGKVISDLMEALQKSLDEQRLKKQAVAEAKKVAKEKTAKETTRKRKKAN
ncbi:MAG: Ku protein [Clostridiales bacterium]|nr:Ku protein [Clostridiales bacterium]